ncbi:MAG: MaoC/PaaZ C-terminal domain-containing protein [Myxococcota bacterium]
MTESDSSRIRYFEDVEPGEFAYHGPGRVVTADEIKRFAREFDPMPFHVDEAAAKASILGRLCASSVHVLAIGSQLAHEGMGNETDEMAVLSGLGWDKVRLVSPLFAGDHVRVRSRVASKRASGSRPECGIVTMDNQVVRADTSLIASYKISVLVRKRPTQAG